MKKLKLMLSGIAILAVIGGAFAFKAKNAFGSTIWTSTTYVGTNACNVENVHTTYTNSQQTGQTKVYYTINAPGPCEENTVTQVHTLVYTIQVL